MENWIAATDLFHVEIAGIADGIGKGAIIDVLKDVLVAQFGKPVVQELEPFGERVRQGLGVRSGERVEEVGHLILFDLD